MELARLRDAMAHHPAAVAVVGARAEDGLRGLTATSFTSVSLEPPLVLVCLDSLAATRETVLRAHAFTISLLSTQQEFLADRFAGLTPLVDPLWREIPHRVAGNGGPILDGCIGWFECRVHAVHAGGDHDIVVGEVTAAGREPGDPLIRWDRAFWRLAAH